MTGPFEELAGLDKLIHEPARLAICTALGACDRADFVYLQRLTGLSKGNLSAHLAKLEAAKIVHIHKGFRGKIPRTEVELSNSGRAALQRHWQRLDELRQGAAAWQPGADPTDRDDSLPPQTATPAGRSPGDATQEHADG